MPQDNTHIHETLRRAWSRDELQDNAKKWMKSCASDYSRDEYNLRLGLLIDFVTDLFDGFSQNEK